MAFLRTKAGDYKLLANAIMDEENRSNNLHVAVLPTEGHIHVDGGIDVEWHTLTQRQSTRMTAKNSVQKRQRVCPEFAAATLNPQQTAGQRS